MISVLDGSIRLRKHAHFNNPSEDGVWLAASVIPKGQTILDAGCGTGIVSLCLKYLHPQLAITGLDIQAEALSIASENATLNNMHINWANGDITEPPFKAGSFDMVVSNPPFHLVEKGFDSARNNTAFATTKDMITLWVKNMLELATQDGMVYLIHHAQNAATITEAAHKYHVNINYLETSQDKPAKRILVQIDKSKSSALTENTLPAYRLRESVLSTGKII